jgi:hypothetical protein
LVILDQDGNLIDRVNAGLVELDGTLVRELPRPTGGGSRQRAAVCE